jgi:hypothetical protein
VFSNSITAAKICQEILSYIRTEKGEYSDWYVGITSNPHIRLFQEHNVKVNNSWWVISKASDVHEARLVEKTFIEVYGTDGGSRGGDEKSVYVYAYKKTETTIP